MKRIQHRRYTVGVLNIMAHVEYDDAKALDRLIDYTGPGWYSLSDDGAYRRGKFATYSRIRVSV